MNSIVRNVLVLVGGLLLGMAANMLFLMLGMAVFPVEGITEMTP